MIVKSCSQNWEFKARRQESTPQGEQSDQEEDPDDHDGEYDGYDEEDWHEGEEEENAEYGAEVDFSATDEEFCPSEAARKDEQMQNEKEKERKASTTNEAREKQA